MDEDVLDILEQLGYAGPLLDPVKFTEAVNGGPKSVEFTQLVEWFSKELRSLCMLDDNVNAITSPDDSGSFLLEVSSFLKELNCPHETLLKNNVNQRLQTVENRLLLLVYLGTEVQAARINSFNESSTSKGMEVEVSESETAKDLKAMLIGLSISKPPATITPKQLFSKINEKVTDCLKGLPSEVLKNPLFNGFLSPQQWRALSQLHKEMFDDYTLRRQMLLKRLDVTIQSFQWSGKAKDNRDAIAAKFGPLRRQLSVTPNVSISSLIAAREDLAILEKTSSSSVRKNTKSEINKVLIGRVPDRGGRPSEQQAPPPEMPSWQKRTEPGQAPTSGKHTRRKHKKL
ncbi:hypothetical protein CHUAL_006547 [Chamberlinius hualienensis]